MTYCTPGLLSASADGNEYLSDANQLAHERATHGFYRTP